MDFGCQVCYNGWLMKAPTCFYSCVLGIGCVRRQYRTIRITECVNRRVDASESAFINHRVYHWMYGPWNACITDWICITECMHHWVVASPSDCVTECMHHWVYASPSVCLTECMHHWVYASPSVCITVACTCTLDVAFSSMYTKCTCYWLYIHHLVYASLIVCIT